MARPLLWRGRGQVNMYREHEPLSDDELHVLQGLLERFLRHHAAGFRAKEHALRLQEAVRNEESRRVRRMLQDVS